MIAVVAPRALVLERGPAAVVPRFVQRIDRENGSMSTPPSFRHNRKTKLHGGCVELDMDIQSQLKGVTPLKGHLEVLQTVQEVHPVEETGEACVAEIDIKSANKVVKLLDSKFPRDPNLSTTHLRRFAKADFLPESLKEKFVNPVSPLVIYVLIPTPVPERTVVEALLQQFAPIPPLSNNDDNATPKEPSIRIESTRIPLQPPTSEEQARKWCTTLWPTMYNAAARPASHSPPPLLVTQMKPSIEPHAGLYLSIARLVGREAQQSGRGREVGVVVIDPIIAAENPDDPLAAIVTVAGDARYWDADGKYSENTAKTHPYDPDMEGHPAHHALMRAVSMVSHKRLTLSSTPASSSPQSTPEPPSSMPVSPTPLTPPPTALESHILSTSPLLPPSGGGYLCTGLDIYSTHEPCLCCAMGMLLSRFRAVIVPARKAGRGRVDASLDAEHGYGLHWRAELNWRAVGFEFVEVEEGDGREEAEFHA